MIVIAGVLDTGRHDSRNDIGLRIEPDGSANDSRVGSEAGAPQTIAQNSLASLRGDLIRSREFTASLRSEAENAEVSGSDLKRSQHHRLTRGSGKLDIVADDASGRIERLIAR